MKTRQTRREFIGLTSLAAVGLASRPARVFGSGTDPDLVVLHAKAYTMDPRAPLAEAFAVTRDRFTAVGRSAEIKALAGKRTRIVDAKGMTVVPGFIDCHNHADGDVLLNEVLVGNPFEVEFVTLESIVDKLKARAAQTPPGTWVEGFFFDDTKVKDQRPLTRADLDGVSREHPIAVHHRGGHTAFYNSKAFELAHVTRDTPDPMGGTFDRDANGELSGRVTDRAMEVLDAAGSRPVLSAEQAEKRERDALAYISKQFARYGLTSVHHQGGNLQAMQDVRERGELRHRIGYEPYRIGLDAMLAGGIETGFGDEWIRYGATAEHTVDGSFSERTMALSVPYPNRTPPYQGNITETQETLDAWVERVHRAGIRVNCHANGDVAIGMYLTALERAFAKRPRPDARPKITHCTLLDPELIRRIKAVGAVPALFTSYAYYNPDKFVYYGEEMMKSCMAFRSLLDAGVAACAVSDFSPGPFAPLMGIQGMVTRRGWNGKVWGENQRISVGEAIAVNTTNGAWASREEALKGSITAGKLADYVVLAEDPHTVDPEKIKDVKVVRTVVGGTVSYQS
jgi:predicted amidohydrolase YtcJ